MRSSYIYVVLFRLPPIVEIAAAFTVKHELETWWAEHGDRCNRVYRVRACDQEVTDITNEL